MRPQIFYLLALLLVIFNLLITESAFALDQNDIAKMHSTYEANQARFQRDYVGKQFSAALPFAGMRESPWVSGKYTVELGIKKVVSDIECSITDREAVRSATDYDKGDLIRVRGKVADHSFGSIIIDDCSLNKEQ